MYSAKRNFMSGLDSSPVSQGNLAWAKAIILAYGFRGIEVYRGGRHGS